MPNGSMRRSSRPEVHGQRAREAPGPRPASPTPPLEQALEVLAGGREERFGIDLPEGAEPKAPQAVPLLGLAEERLHPHRPLAHRLLIWLSGVGGADAVERGLIEAAPHKAATGAGRTVA